MFGRAHPRSRGENACIAVKCGGWFGSSPLTRGKRSELLQARRGGRLIPAHAGKTEVRSVDEETRSAHPRSRGENASSSIPIRSAYGSSPLTRGKQARALRMSETLRLIPAHAGKTFATLPKMEPISAHPRSRGENGPLPAQGMTLEGSSPLTRGKRCA